MSTIESKLTNIRIKEKEMLAKNILCILYSAVRNNLSFKYPVNVDGTFTITEVVEVEAVAEMIVDVPVIVVALNLLNDDSTIESNHKSADIIVNLNNL